MPRAVWLCVCVRDLIPRMEEARTRFASHLPEVPGGVQFRPASLGRGRGYVPGVVLTRGHLWLRELVRGDSVVSRLEKWGGRKFFFFVSRLTRADAERVFVTCMGCSLFHCRDARAHVHHGGHPGRLRRVPPALLLHHHRPVRPAGSFLRFPSLHHVSPLPPSPYQPHLLN
jgi:hypothetical protein